MPLRREADPLITPRDIPALRPDLVDVSSVFNPGAVRWNDRELLLLRVQTRGRTTVLLPAEVTETGVKFVGGPIDTEALEAIYEAIDKMESQSEITIKELMRIKKRMEEDQ